MRTRHYLLVLFFLSTIGLLLSNPNESRYLTKIHRDYSSHHFGSSLSAETIKEIGERERVSYLLFSTYTYRFGNRKAYYFGIANSIFFLGSKRYRKKAEELKVV